MLNLDGPTIITMDVVYNGSGEKIYLHQMSLALLEIWQGGNEKPLNTVKLDESTKKYI